MEEGDFTWEDCIAVYSGLENDLAKFKLGLVDEDTDYIATLNHRIEQDRMMVKLIEQLRDDPEIPNLKRSISHLCLRLWHPDIKGAEVHIEPVKKDRLWIGFNQYEEVEVPLEVAAKTVKHFLKKITTQQINRKLEKDETGEIESELKSLPLEWVHAAALIEIYAISLRHGQYTVNLEQDSDIPNHVLKQIAANMAEITKFVMKTWEIAREKRSQAWLEELEKDND